MCNDNQATTKDLPLWIVSRIKGAKAVYIANVVAKDAESAIAFVVKDSAITDPELIKRLVARPAPD